MRVAAKTTLIVLILYILVLIGVGFWIENELRLTVRKLMEDTARLVGQEVATALHEQTMDQLLAGTTRTRQELRQSLKTATSLSAVLESLAVIDQAGKVVASDDQTLVGSQFAVPAKVFADSREPRLFSSFDRLFGGGRHILYVPMRRGDALVGYVQLGLSNSPIADLYDRVYTGFSLVALGGLMAIIGLGLLLHWELSRLGQGLADVLEAALTGRAPLGSVAPTDEFIAVRTVANRLGQELSEARGRAEFALQELDTLAKVSNVGVLLLGPQGRLEFINAAGRELLAGNSPDDLEAPWEAVREALEQAYRRVQEQGTLTARVDREINDQGVVRRLRFEIHAVDNRQWKGCLVLIKNRQMMEALDTDLRAAARFRSLSRLYMGAAHDLKAPLNAMVVNLEMLKQTIARGDATAAEDRERQGHYVQVLKEEVARLNRYLTTLLEQANPGKETRAIVDLRPLVVELDSLLAPQARRQQVTLHHRLPDQPVLVLAHADRLKQALLNIIINGLDAMPKGGRLEITVAVAESQGRLSICDTGPGIPSSLLNHIFDMHFTTKDTGTGIGLYVARSVIRQYGGEIEVETELGKGSCFHVVLPLTGTATA